MCPGLGTACTPQRPGLIREFEIGKKTVHEVMRSVLLMRGSRASGEGDQVFFPVRDP